MSESQKIKYLPSSTDMFIDFTICPLLTKKLRSKNAKWHLVIASQLLFSFDLHLLFTLCVISRINSLIHMGAGGI